MFHLPFSIFNYCSCIKNVCLYLFLQCIRCREVTHISDAFKNLHGKLREIRRWRRVQEMHFAGGTVAENGPWPVVHHSRLAIGHTRVDAFFQCGGNVLKVQIDCRSPKPLAASGSRGGGSCKRNHRRGACTQSRWEGKSFMPLVRVSPAALCAAESGWQRALPVPWRHSSAHRNSLARLRWE